MDHIILFYTDKLFKTIEKNGQIDYIYANKDRLKRCKYLIAISSNYTLQQLKDEIEINRGSAFFIGKISNITSSIDGKRLNIEFSRYALVNIPEVWGFTEKKNPVSYTNTSDFSKKHGVKFDNLEWKKFPHKKAKKFVNSEIKPLTVKEAKEGLAKSLGISTSCIEIIIKT